MHGGGPTVTAGVPLPKPYTEEVGTVCLNKPISRSSQCSTTGVTKCYVLSCLWDGEYKRTLAANQKE